MSSTTTAAPITNTLSILGDYEVHHSAQHGPASNDIEPPLSVNPRPNWPTHHRRIPAYRPINYHLDQSERPAGSNGIEWAFIGVMLHGVWLNAVGPLS